LTLLGCPKVLGHKQRYKKKLSQRPKKEDFQKIKNTPLDFHSIHKCVKFNMIRPFITSLCSKFKDKGHFRPTSTMLEFAPNRLTDSNKSSNKLFMESEILYMGIFC